MLTIKKAAVQPATLEKARTNYSNLTPLINLRAAGAMPRLGLVWLGIGFLPMKRNALSINPEQLPTDEECHAVAGLDVIVCIHGHLTKYGMLRRLCGSLYAAYPRRLQVFDYDYRKVAFLKMGGRA